MKGMTGYSWVCYGLCVMFTFLALLLRYQWEPFAAATFVILAAGPTREGEK
jgi:hypothetical protein